MKPKVVLLLFISFWGFKGLYAQNMVVNPSLEPTTCDWEILDDLNYNIYLKNWFVDERFNGMGGNYYVSKCSVEEDFHPPEFRLFAKNYQRVLFDKSHAIIACSDYYPSTGERRSVVLDWQYLNGYLKQPLQKDYIYVGAFYCNLLDFYAKYFTQSIDFYPVYYISHLDMRLGASHILRDTVRPASELPIVLQAQVQNPRDRMLSDTMHFMEVKDTFVAKGNERVVQIGDFMPPDSVIGGMLCCSDTFKKYSRLIMYYIDGVSVFAYPDLPNDTISICQGDSVAIKPHVPPGTSYFWQNGDSNVVQWAKQSGWLVCETHTRFSYARDSVYINVIAKDHKEFVLHDTTLCKGNALSVQVKNLGNMAISWSDGEKSFKRSFNQAGQYGYTIQGSHCQWQYSFALAFDSLNLFLGHDTAICANAKITLQVNEPNSAINWWNGKNDTSLAVGPGSYWVSLARNGCFAADTIHIAELQYPWFALTDTSLCNTDNYDLNMGGFSEYKFAWSNGSSNNSFSTKESGAYFVRVKTPCETFTDSFAITFEDCACRLFVPNAISPDGNGLNEYFAISSNCHIQQLELKVFNLWGQMIFKSEDYQNDWSPKQIAMGNYFYLLKAEMVNLKNEKTSFETSGNLLILK